MTKMRIQADPTVTVAIPCYGQEPFLFECLNSLVAQTMSAWEAIVVDDCSPRGTAARIVEQYDDPRIRYIRHPVNRGLAASRNTAIAAGKAPYVLCLDADDFLDPTYLATMLPLVRDGADCAYPDFRQVGSDNGVMDYGVHTSEGLTNVQWIPGPGTLMRRSVWERVGGYCEADELRSGNEDWEFWIGAASERLSATHVAQPLYFYRRHGGTMSMSSLARDDWRTREFIVARRSSYFSEQRRRKAFLLGGLMRSLRAQIAARNVPAATALLMKVARLDPSLAAYEAGALTRRALGRGYRVARSVGGSVPDERPAPDRVARQEPRDWDKVAQATHERYGHLSHDFAVLEQVIGRSGARSVLEIGAGSGRLVPVYLHSDMASIRLQDISSRALELCRQRFAYQRQIAYSVGPLDAFVPQKPSDLVVSNRVLQHVVDDAEAVTILARLTRQSRWFYLNETQPDDATADADPSLRARDYAPIFARLGFRQEATGTLRDERGARQVWQLFVNAADRGTGRP